MKILIADDDKNLRRVHADALAEEGHAVAATDSGADALELLAQDEYDVLLLDLNMPRVSGMEVLKQVRERGLPTEVIILTGHATVHTAVEAMKLGACDYLAKPFKLDELRIVVRRAYEKKQLLRENMLLRTQLRLNSGSRKIVTRSPVMHDLLRTVAKVAMMDFPVLVCGQSGSGKELVARAIHDASTRASGPFIPLNCGAIPETVFESELFGHEAGAFTGAQARKPGLLEIAANGTLFLDEIGEMPLSLQVKLLRVLETKRFYRVGGTKEVSVDVRFVAATNKDLQREGTAGRFRSDLYYRLSALTLQIPPLRERTEDIPLLIEEHLASNPAYRSKKFSAEALRVLEQYSWPGNVREIQNVVNRTLLLSQGDVITPADLPADMHGASAASSCRLEDVEREHILKVLRECGGSRAKAVELLGISSKTLYNKLSSYGSGA